MGYSDGVKRILVSVLSLLLFAEVRMSELHITRSLFQNTTEDVRGFGIKNSVAGGVLLEHQDR